MSEPKKYEPLSADWVDIWEKMALHPHEGWTAQDVLRLIATIRALQAERDGLREELEKVRAHFKTMENVIEAARPYATDTPGKFDPEELERMIGTYDDFIVQYPKVWAEFEARRNKED